MIFFIVKFTATQISANESEISGNAVWQDSLLTLMRRGSNQGPIFLLFGEYLLNA